MTSLLATPVIRRPQKQADGLSRVGQSVNKQITTQVLGNLFMFCLSGRKKSCLIYHNIGSKPNISFNTRSKKTILVGLNNF